MRNRVYNWPGTYGNERVMVTAEVEGEAGAGQVCVTIERNGQDITGEVIDLLWLDDQRELALELDGHGEGVGGR